LRYHGGGRQKLKPGDALALATICLAPGVRSLSAAYRRLPAPAATIDAYRYALPGPVRKPLADLLTARRKAEALGRALRRAIDKLDQSKGATHAK
jgi:hypothetical protein